MGFTRSTSWPERELAPSMNVSVEARAPTTPPDMGASTKRPWLVQWTAFATSRLEVGSMVEQSMKRRSDLWAVGGRGPARMEWKTLLTCEGPGRTVSIVDCLE